MKPSELSAIDAEAAGPELAARLRAVFDQGRLLGLPTETVYGLAAPIDRPELIAQIFALKGRPAENPLIVHVGSLEQARRVTREWPAAADALACAFWPGPLTLVLPRAAGISDQITAGRDTVAVRMPDHPLALAILRALDMPLVAPSANPYTRLSPTRAEDVRAVFSPAQVEVLDGGPCRVGIESTIVGIDSARRVLSLLRPGQIARTAILRHLPADWVLDTQAAHGGESGAQLAPGRMREHYRPQRPLHVHVWADPALARSLRDELAAQPTRCLVELPESAAATARVLYRRLREADARGGAVIDLLLPAQHLADPAWEGVINRLHKAASVWHQQASPAEYPAADDSGTA